ncbi:SdiA-regulated domain-containing protein [Pseudomonas sp. No.21]|uniref:SdiA-regulated domain-containing protein n=1 Tax=Pseudomonas TaxID=286 RepID=UPI000DA79417|nr:MULTISPECIES: SdiA-regulated domain-containing protein [Pseudomonas]MDW3713304.1 SdiA-regulated domain-containing protein [Pseudomonas sp. 2023EL-01195]PZE12019.1 hypothetical protein DMX10_18230 [Pseudomonas sp. 57B-090624]GJN45700.1 hypothetical protein TUM20249_16860 [Pseudomonas tohonis]
MSITIDPNVRSIRPRRRFLALGLYGLGALALALLVLASGKFHWHDRVWFYVVSRLNADQWRQESLWLPDFKVDIEAMPVIGVDDDLSAIDFAEDRRQLLAVTNASPRLLELDFDGKVTAQYPLVGFEDVEGITYMGDGVVAVVDEVQQQLVFFHIPEHPGEGIDKRDCETLAIPLASSAHNKGLEGITYDAVNDRLFVAKERDPRKLYVVSGVKASLGHRMRVKVEDLSDWITDSVFAKDISDLHFDQRTGHLLVLSDESRLVIELNGSGKAVSIRSLRGGDDLKHDAPQPEGLTLDNQGTLYVVSEPNLFYRFKKH